MTGKRGEDRRRRGEEKETRSNNHGLPPCVPLVDRVGELEELGEALGRVLPDRRVFGELHVDHGANDTVVFVLVLGSFNRI